MASKRMVNGEIVYKKLKIGKYSYTCLYKEICRHAHTKHLMQNKLQEKLACKCHLSLKIKAEQILLICM